VRGSAAHRVVGKLLTAGLVEETPAGGALPVWRRDDAEGGFALRITPRGLAAIRVDEGGETPEAQEPGNTEQGAAPATEKPSRRATNVRRRKIRKEQNLAAALIAQYRLEDGCRHLNRVSRALDPRHVFTTLKQKGASASTRKHHPWKPHCDKCCKGPKQGNAHQ